jgi:hypothetical protein
LYPLSQKSKIFASSPRGRAKAACGGKLPDKLKFEKIHCYYISIYGKFPVLCKKRLILQILLVSMGKSVYTGYRIATVEGR